MKKFRSFPLIFFFVSIFFAGISLPDPLLAQQPNSKDVKTAKITPEIEAARKMVNATMQEQKIPGLSITVMKNGQVIWSEGFGYADLENKVPVQASHTRFRIGSVSKTLTAAAMAILFENGQLELDAKVQKYVPYFPEKKYPITVRQVAGHTAGIHHYLNAAQFLSAVKYNSVKESLDIFKDDTLLFEPGTKYNYSTYGWNLISAVVEGASQMPFLEYMQKTVFDKLGMNNTSADKNDSIITGRTRFYALTQQKDIVNAPYVDNSNKWAGGGFISTSEDIARFAAAHCKAGFVNESTLKLFTASQKLSDGKETGYGIGWASGKQDNGRTYYGHTGGSIGGITFMRVYPAEQLAIAVVTNSSDASPHRMAVDIAELFMKTSKN